MIRPDHIAEIEGLGEALQIVGKADKLSVHNAKLPQGRKMSLASHQIPIRRLHRPAGVIRILARVEQLSVDLELCRSVLRLGIRSLGT